MLQALVEEVLCLTAIRHGLTSAFCRGTIELALMLYLICLLRAHISFSVDG
jgi:hypothetical protein